MEHRGLDVEGPTTFISVDVAPNNPPTSTEWPAGDNPFGPSACEEQFYVGYLPNCARELCNKRTQSKAGA